MGSRVAVLGTGHAGYAATTPGLSYKELMFEAARRAYEDAGVDPRRDVDSFVCVSEDFQEGTSIFDEYVPDQLGAVRRPVQTVSSDGLAGVATGVMLILSGVASVVVVEAHSKASDVITQGRIDQFAMDPVLNRPLDISPLAVAGLEMHAYLHATAATEEQCAEVAARNRSGALGNPRAAYGERVDAEEVRSSRPLFSPLREGEVARSADGCVVLVLASEDRAGSADVWLTGVGWSSASASLEERDWTRADDTAKAAEMAYAQAGISNPAAEIGLAEVDDTYAYRELMHLEALGLAPRGEAGALLQSGGFGGGAKDLPAVNPSGGSLGEGYLHEANGLARLLACVEHLRGDAGEGGNADVAVAQSWRGVPSASAAVAVLERDRR